jgi:hypothetical protein
MITWARRFPTLRLAYQDAGERFIAAQRQSDRVLGGNYGAGGPSLPGLTRQSMLACGLKY